MRQIRLILVILLLWMNFSLLESKTQLPNKCQYSNFQETQPEVTITKKVEIQRFSPYEPIVISSDSEFESQGFPGSGTDKDPYLIEGFNITSSTGVLIAVRSTIACFTIRNNLLNGLSTALSGIVLEVVSNGIIENNIIVNHVSDGILLQRSNDIVITNNTISENSFGIQLGMGTTSENVRITVLNNTIRNNINGIKSYLSGNNNILSSNYITGNQVGIMINGGMETISNNIISDNSQQGIIFSTCNLPSSISNNTISNNGYQGIYTIGSSDIIISNNTIVNNEKEGIFLSDSSNTRILNNIISNNKDYGILLDEFTKDITISGNYFGSNNPWGGSQARNDGIRNSFEHNSWDDWINNQGSYPIDRSRNPTEGTQTTQPTHRESFPTLPNHNTNVIAGILILGIILSGLIVGLRKQR